MPTRSNRDRLWYMIRIVQWYDMICACWSDWNSLRVHLFLDCEQLRRPIRIVIIDCPEVVPRLLSALDGILPGSVGRDWDLATLCLLSARVICSPVFFGCWTAVRLRSSIGRDELLIWLLRVVKSETVESEYRLAAELLTGDGLRKRWVGSGEDFLGVVGREQQFDSVLVSNTSADVGDDGNKRGRWRTARNRIRNLNQ